MQRHGKESVSCFGTYLKAGNGTSATTKQVSRGCVNNGARGGKIPRQSYKGRIFIGLFLFSSLLSPGPPLYNTGGARLTFATSCSAFCFCFYDNTLRISCCNTPYRYFLYIYTFWHSTVPETNSILCACSRIRSIVIAQHLRIGSFS